MAIVCLTSQVSAGEPLKIGRELLVSVPEGWVVEGNAELFPCRLVRQDETAELLLFRTVLEGEDQVTSELELKAAVDTVIANVIADLPGGVLLASTGIAEPQRAEFVIDFESFDAARIMTLQHRFVGLLYRIDDTRQYLYAVWVKAPKDSYEALRGELQGIQDNVSYTGPKVEPVFARRQSSMSWLPIVGLLLAVFLLFYPRYARSRRQSSGRGIAASNESGANQEVGGSTGRTSPQHRIKSSGTTQTGR